MLLFMQKVAIIIPCYNEERRLNYKNIEPLLLNSTIDVYFANDGSKDNTLEIINSIIANQKQRLHLINFTENSGKANTIFKAINQIHQQDKYDFIGYFDADFSTPSDEIIRLVDEISKRKCEFLIGSRILLLNSFFTLY